MLFKNTDMLLTILTDLWLHTRRYRWPLQYKKLRLSSIKWSRQLPRTLLSRTAELADQAGELEQRTGSTYCQPWSTMCYKAPRAIIFLAAESLLAALHPHNPNLQIYQICQYFLNLNIQLDISCTFSARLVQAQDLAEAGGSARSLGELVLGVPGLSPKCPMHCESSQSELDLSADLQCANGENKLVRLLAKPWWHGHHASDDS